MKTLLLTLFIGIKLYSYPNVYSSIAKEVYPVRDKCKVLILEKNMLQSACQSFLRKTKGLPKQGALIEHNSKPKAYELKSYLHALKKAQKDAKTIEKYRKIMFSQAITSKNAKLLSFILSNRSYTLSHKELKQLLNLKSTLKFSPEALRKLKNYEQTNLNTTAQYTQSQQMINVKKRQLKRLCQKMDYRISKYNLFTGSINGHIVGVTPKGYVVQEGFSKFFFLYNHNLNQTYKMGDWVNFVVMARGFMNVINYNQEDRFHVKTKEKRKMPVVEYLQEIDRRCHAN